MQIHYYSEITAFKDLVTPFLLQYEAENNLILGLLERLAQNVYTFSETEKPVLIAITKNNRLELVSIRTPPRHKQLLSYTESLETIKFLVDEMSKTTIDLPGVLGFKAGALQFAHQWARKKKISYKLEMHERIYKLDKVNKNTIGSNPLYVATPEEKDRLFDYLKAFIKGIFPRTSDEEIIRSQQRLEQSIEQQKVYVLKIDNRIVSMVKRAGETPNGERINMVYTPPAERRKGYATETVAKVSQRILDEGKKFCFLFTDLANPTSNKIYQTIGYEPVIDMDDYRFED